MVSTPITRPTQSLAVRLRKKAPWPQSCWIMNRRTTNPAAGTISTAAHQKPCSSANQAATHSPASGVMLTTISQMLRSRLGSR